MFTGIVQELGTVKAVDLTAAGGRLSISGPKTVAALRIDDSVAVNGVCLTVVDLAGDIFTAEVVPETLSRTNLGQLAAGDPVCLEPAVTMATPLGGHLVQGHVDGMATITERRREGLQEAMRFQAAPEILRYVVPKAFIALDGVSLTVVECDERAFSIALIPHSAAMTTLGRKAVGQRVNVEVDLVAKYVERFVSEQAASHTSKEGMKESRHG
ncbi:MAG: riboflavin synthase [Chloroflexota bacterium]|nr:riboflavin synthase [Chloroflexota bacterium]